MSWDEDRPLPEDDAIDAAHPMRTGRHDLYEEAMRLVGAKHSKGALVELVNWLLARATSAEALNDDRGGIIARLNRDLDDLQEMRSKALAAVETLKPDAEAWRRRQREKRERDDAAERGGDW